MSGAEVSEASSVGASSTKSSRSNAVDPIIARQIETLRRNLLDIGTRNRLVSAPLKSSRANVLEIIDERADHVFATLWRESAGLTFAHNETAQPAASTEEGTSETDDGSDSVPVYVPVEEPSEEGVASRHKDNQLQTRLLAEPLQKRLLTLQRDSALFEEEQGVNILFLAVGFIKWFEADSSDVERFAPLILIPATLERDRVRSRFKLKRREEDIEVNLSLQAKLKQDFGIDLPELPEGDEWQPSDYYSLVERAISTKGRWTVERDSMLLGFFSFSKFLLYRDLDPAQWPEAQRLDQNRIVSGLLGEGFDEEPLPITEEHNLDDLLEPIELGHVLDADSSQAAVVKMAADGRSMVVQGPPGTGKSQTIANVIAAAVRDGKTILFVAEKMAALQVVYDRLRGSGLDALCLELHSHKANKRAVLEELQRTLELGRVAGSALAIATATKAARDELNFLSKLLHTPPGELSETPFQVIATLVKARGNGLPPPDFTLEQERLSGIDENKKAIAALEVLRLRVTTSGPSSAHPWRGVRNRLTPVDRERLRPQLERIQSIGATSLAAIAKGTALLGIILAKGAADGRDTLKWLEHFKFLPTEISRLIESDFFRQDPSAALALLQAASDVSHAHADVAVHTSEIGISQDWTKDRQAIASRGQSLFRFLSGQYRRSVALIDSVSVAGPAKTFQERIRRLDAIMALQLSARRLAESEGRGRATFGTDWSGQQTATEPLRRAVEWYLAGQSLTDATKLLDNAIRFASDRAAIIRAADELRTLLSDFEQTWSSVRSALDLDVAVSFDDANRAPDIASIVGRAAQWLSEFDRIDEWFGLIASEDECRTIGLSTIVDRLASGVLAPDQAIDTYKYARAEALWKHMIATVPALGSRRGDERTTLVKKFRDLERELFIATAREIAARHTAEIPSGALGQMGYVRGQIARRRGHAAIRKLMENAGEAVQKIKPVFLMSPISVAQFLPPGSATFDLVLMDEASQVRPEDAIGAVARGGSMVVVGDNKQLPPTHFFDRTIGAIADDADDDSSGGVQTTVAAGAMESILTLCQARGLPGRTLQWHYRSRHPSLIQVSNQAFYEQKLKFPPSPESAGRDGLIFRRLNGAYDRGRTRTNAVEAKAVAEAVISHIREAPNLSLGVATLSVTQRDAILAELELLRARHSEFEQFFDRSKPEPFFVKNLENVQGDERDVIYVSICYARDADGYMAQGFGPVSSEGGERRLNVLFTRAKRRCEIFSSIGHADIELRGASVPVGRRILHTYLKFAETGETDVPMATGLDADSEFELAVGSRLRAAGYHVDYQVGSAGFRIDIGVRDPSYSNAYILGVECDGATYHSALWARERDRLRQQVLESKGWRLHRIWSTDWFNRPDAELRKLLAAIDAAKAAHKSEVDTDREAREAIRIEREAIPQVEAISVPYQEADIPKLDAYPEPHLVPTGLMTQYVIEVVRIEQPIHTDEVAKRVARAWGAQRTGTRIRTGVAKALSVAKAEGKLAGEPFWRLPDGTVQVRDRSSVGSASLRQPELLPPAEIDQAIIEAISRSVAVDNEEVARGVAEALGFSATSAQLRAVVGERARRLVAAATITETHGLLRLASGT
jgi:very-short-patch-repair endonuclease